MSDTIELKRNAPTTHKGGPAVTFGPAEQLRRAVSSCLLWEDTFYEDGQTIADRIRELTKLVDTGEVLELAAYARGQLKLRKVPLQLLVSLVKNGDPVPSSTYPAVIQRVDEMATLLEMTFEGKDKTVTGQKLPRSMKRGLARAFRKFDAYQLGKYNRDGIKLIDILRLVHPKPETEEQAALWGQIIAGTLESPDTWEVALSKGADKKETFTRLLQEGKLGYLALLRNLRNMEQAGVDRALVGEAILARKGAYNVLPFRFVAAMRAAPTFAPVLDQALLSQIADMPTLPGRTLVLCDVSGSMRMALSNKSDLTRLDAAATLASIIHGDDVRTFPFNNNVWELPYKLGLAGIDAIRYTPSGGTKLGAAVVHANGVGYDRLIVITDEQASDLVPEPLQGTNAYMINVSVHQNGVGYGDWVRINGFSESILRFIATHEGLDG